MQIFKLIFLFLFSCIAPALSQITYYQDIFQGEVVVIGTSTADANGIVQFETNLQPNTVVKKVFLVCAGNKGFNYIPNFKEFKIDNQLFQVTNNNPTEFLVNNLTQIPLSADYNGHITFVKDMSNDITIVNDQLTLEWINDPVLPPGNCPSCRISAPMLIILVENLSLPAINFVLTINNQMNNLELDFSQNELNPANFIYPIALNIHSDRLGGGPDDGYSFKINDIPAGLIRSTDNFQYSIYSGAVGCYHYSNYVLTGLTDDNPDSIFWGPTAQSDSADGLAIINGYCTNGNLNPFNFKVAYTGTSYGQHNTFISYSLAYITLCDSFSVTSPNDTTICQGSTLQLNATSTNPSATYEWLPATGLSCSTCPNPIFTADSSMFYTVRIWNNDSCSVVRPLKINVRPKPTFGAITTAPSECGAPVGSAAAGSVTLNALPDNGIVANWQEVGGATQSSNVFSGLSPGNHTFYFLDTNGCQSADTTFFVDEVNSTSANFSVSPQSGAVPLTVVFTNQSVNATNYEWFVSTGSTTISEGSNLQIVEFSNSGTYEIMLVAWQFDPSCADTAYQTISVYDSLVVTIPNVFTPNGDGINDFFSLSANQDVSYEISILNRWGEVVFSENSYILAGTSKNVWNGTSTSSVPVTDGVYFLTLKLIPEKGEVVEIEDFVTVVR